MTWPQPLVTAARGAGRRKLEFGSAPVRGTKFQQGVTLMKRHLLAGLAMVLLVSPMDASPLAYAATIGADGKASFGIVDLSRGVFHKLTSLPNPVGALGFVKEGAFYSIDNHNVLVRIDATTGIAKDIGPTRTNVPPSLPPDQGSNPIAVLGDGRIFSIDLYGMLYSVDPATGASKVLGSTGIPVPDYTDPQATFNNGFTSVGNQLYYLWGGGDSKRNIPVHLYRIDPETYLTYDVGPTGIDAIGSLGTAQGRLFGCVFAPDTFVPLAIAEVDLLTGKATVYSSLPGQEFILAISDTPEPTPGSQRPPLTGLDISSPHRLAHRMSPR
jgi:hypothetical protein